MSRTDRLLKLMQLMRTYRMPVSAQILSQELGISLRTLYRDIQTLRDQGIEIHGESGLGYLLQSDNILPPLKFTDEELNSIILGLRWVSRHGDEKLIQASSHAIAKIKSILPSEIQNKLLDNPLMVFSPKTMNEVSAERLIIIRQAIDKEKKLVISYRDGNDESSVRTIYPLVIGFMQDVQLLAARCELRKDFRNFRLDRIIEVNVLEENFFPSHQFWLRRWHLEQDIPLP
ncbi:MAG: YafY family transcriptional regulator [Acinetobacter sp.]|nr:YafY family transcriptional regulator [Acinetobacter sp.]